MRTSVATVAVLVAATALVAPAFPQTPNELAVGAGGSAHAPLVKLRVHPSSGVVLLGDRMARDNTDSSFDFVSAVCPDCGGPCPPVSRTVEVTLAANTAVAGGYGVSNLVNSNYTVTNVSYSTQGPLTDGQQLVITIVGDVIDCGTWFNVWFSVCDQAPLAWDDPCPVVTLLYEFAGTDGQWPAWESMTISGSTLYGTTQRGGSSNEGVVFALGTDGSGFTPLHQFAGYTTGDGSYPLSNLVVTGSTLYGATSNGGTWDSGTVYAVDLDGNNYRQIHVFRQTDGAYPQGGLTLSGSTLYGTAYEFGTYFNGVIFKVDTDGNNFAVLRHFQGGASDGNSPAAPLVLDGSTLYGTTTNGGPDPSYGVVFSIGTDGNGFTLLHTFDGSDGFGPYGLTLVGNTLYGVTVVGGANNGGVLYSMGTDGNGFTVLRHFAGGVSDGLRPYGALTLSGSTLFGMTYDGGNSDAGVIFSIRTDGGGFALLHEFVGGVDDGSTPDGSLTLSGSVLYGGTRLGGDSNKGVIFRLE